MKRRSIVIILVFVLSLVAVGASALEAADIVGTWYLNAIEMNGATASPDVMGLEMTMTLDADGTALLVMSGQDDSAGTWKIENGELAVDDGITVSVMTLSDDTLVTDMYGVTMSFGKTKEEAPIVEIAPARIVADVAEYNGTWKGVHVDYMGTLIPLAIVEMDLTLTISGGTIQLDITESGQGDAQSMTADGELVEGTLLATMGDGETAQTVMLQLLEDGTLSYTIADEDTVGTIYCEKAEVAP